MFFRVLRHLLPDSVAWRIREEGTRAIDRLFAGLASVFASVRDFADLALLDLYPAHTRELDAHLAEFAVTVDGNESAKRLALAAAWAATGGQSPAYLQGVVQAAGFDLYIHEWWSAIVDGDAVVRDPRSHTSQPLIGTVQCGEPLAQCGEPTALCNAFLQNNPGYLVNEGLNRRAPPPVPNDPLMWRHFLYWGGETFGSNATVPLTRRRELEELLLKLCPAEKWLVLMVDYDPGADSFELDFSSADNSAHQQTTMSM